MRRNSEIKERQNDETALTLLRASVRCLNNERYIKYLMIFMSFSICLAAIFNRYLPQILPTVENIVEVQSKIATYINLISGVVLVCGIVLGFYVARMHTEGTVLQDRYEAYVFDNSPNLSILRPIPQTMVEIYAKKTRRKRDEKFINYIYSDEDNPSASTAQYEYIKKEVRSDYKLYIYIQPFFLTIWIGFCILVMIIAVSFNDSFITTLINILIPSLSAISTIANSWHGCRLQIKQLQNLQNIIDDIQAMSENKRTAYITDKHNIRLLADGLFAYRASAFVIPNFLKRKYQKSDKAAQHGLAKTAATPKAAEEVAASDAASGEDKAVAVAEAVNKRAERATAVTANAEGTKKAERAVVVNKEGVKSRQTTKSVRQVNAEEKDKTAKPIKAEERDKTAKPVKSEKTAVNAAKTARTGKNDKPNAAAKSGAIIRKNRN